MPETKVQKLYNKNDSVSGRDGGPYLDLEQARRSEELRARAEGREPDLDHPPADGGIMLVTAAQLLETTTVNNLPSQQHLGDYSESAVKGLVDDKENLLEAMSERDLSVLDEPVAEEEKTEEKPPAFTPPASPKK